MSLSQEHNPEQSNVVLTGPEATALLRALPRRDAHFSGPEPRALATAKAKLGLIEALGGDFGEYNGPRYGHQDVERG